MTDLKTPVQHPLAFFNVGQGKWHALDRITHDAACGVWVNHTALRMDVFIVVLRGDLKVHPIVCRRCLKKALSTAPLATLGLLR